MPAQASHLESHGIQRQEAYWILLLCWWGAFALNVDETVASRENSAMGSLPPVLRTIIYNYKVFSTSNRDLRQTDLYLDHLHLLS